MSVVKELKHSFRNLLQTPTFTFAALAALTLGIGTNVAIFSVIDAVILRPVPAPDPARVVVFETTRTEGPDVFASAPKFNFWKQQTRAFQDVSAYRYEALSLTAVDFPRQIEAAQVSASYFRLFGLHTAHGRLFSTEEDWPNAGHFAVLSDEFWKRSFAADPGIIGKTISLSEQPYLVVGIMAAGVQTESPLPIEVWIPFQIAPNAIAENEYFTAAGRLKPGVTLGMANAQLQIALREFNRTFPFDLTMGPQHGFAVQPLRDVLIGNVQPSLWVLFGAVTCVLLIACVNVANLMLARAAGRKHEIAIRAALGARLSHVVAPLIAEGVMLSVAGGALGLLLGTAGIHALLALNPGSIPRIDPNGSTVHADWRVLAFTLVVSIAAGVLFSLVPALQTSKADLSAALKESVGRAGTSMHQNRMRSVLVTGELALAIVLLIGSGLLIRTFLALRSVNPGFDPHNVLTMRVLLNTAGFQNASGLADLVRNSVQRISALPGVIAAASSSRLPLESGPRGPVFILGRHRKGTSDGYVAIAFVSPAYFDVLRIPILRGRAFTDRDEARSTPVVIINQAMAREYWPNRDPFKDRFIAAEPPARQIVGIVADVHETGLDSPASPIMYIPVSQARDDLVALMVRSPIPWIIRMRVEPLSMGATIARELQQTSGGLPVTGVRSLDDFVARSTARQDFNALVMGIFGASAVLLAAVGLYGLIAYSLEQRTQEIGIRLALGAEFSAMREMLILQGLRLTAIGSFIGVGVAFSLTRLVSGFLFGVQPLDPIAFLMAPALLSCAALFSVWLPARRVTNIDPAVALRCD